MEAAQQRSGLSLAGTFSCCQIQVSDVMEIHERVVRGIPSPTVGFLCALDFRVLHMKSLVNCKLILGNAR